MDGSRLAYGGLSGFSIWAKKCVFSTYREMSMILRYAMSIKRLFLIVIIAFIYYLFIYLFICLFVYLFVYLFVCLFIYLLFIYLFVYLFVYLFIIYLFIYLKKYTVGAGVVGRTWNIGIYRVSRV